MWLLKFKPRTSQGLLKVWWADQHNRLEWDIAFLAYLTLKRENIERVVLVSLERRIEAIKFIAKSFGWPLAPFQVRLAADADPTTTRIPSEQLCTIRLGDELRVGYIGTSDDSTLPMKPLELHRPAAAGALMPQRMQRLATTSQQDFEIFQKQFGNEDASMLAIGDGNVREQSNPFVVRKGVSAKVASPVPSRPVPSRPVPFCSSPPRAVQSNCN